MRIRADRRILPLLEALLLGAGVVLLGVFGWYKFEEHYYQARYQTALDHALAQPVETEKSETPAAVPIVHESAAASDPSSRRTRDASAATPIEGLYGRLSSTALGLEVAVADGLDSKTLRRAAGRLPRDGRNTVIAAHRDTFFRPLRNVQPGDDFTLEPIGSAPTKYEVEWMKVVEPSAVTAMQETNIRSLTLITCFPFDWVGPAPRRLIVRARAVDPSL